MVHVIGSYTHVGDPEKVLGSWPSPGYCSHLGKITNRWKIFLSLFFQINNKSEERKEGREFTHPASYNAFFSQLNGLSWCQHLGALRCHSGS